MKKKKEEAKVEKEWLTNAVEVLINSRGKFSQLGIGQLTAWCLRIRMPFSFLLLLLFVARHMEQPTRRALYRLLLLCIEQSKPWVESESVLLPVLLKFPVPCSLRKRNGCSVWQMWTNQVQRSFPEIKAYFMWVIVCEDTGGRRRRRGTGYKSKVVRIIIALRIHICWLWHVL